MPSTIIETRPKPFNRVKIDPITLDIIENAMLNARWEMDAVLFRTAMSPGIREQGDAFPMIANLDGKMVVGQFGSFIYGFKEAYDGTIEEGDIFFMNDPYSCNGAISHANDWLLLRPIFKDGRLVSYAAHFGHMTDIGGKVPGSLPTDARQIFEEGIRVPPTKIFKDDELQEDLFEVILHNCRMPQWNRSDFNAIIASLRTAEKRVLEMCNRFGDDVYYSGLEELLDRNKRAMQKLIRDTIPTTKQSFEDYICDDGMGMGPYKIKCSLWREGNKAVFDFTGTDPQSIASVNFLLNEEMFKMFCGVYMIMVFDPQIMFNDGFYDLIDVYIPEGTLLKPKFPAALSCRTHALGRIFDVLGALLGQGNPDFLNAAGFSDSPHLMYSGHDRKGEWYQLFQIGFGGIPGRPFGDGPDGHSLWPNFTNVPNEFLEAYFPLRIEAYETIPDSGGAGHHRGGNAIHMSYRFLEDGEISIHDDRWLTKPWGVNGGTPGMRSTKLLERADGTSELLPSKCDNIVVKEGDLLHFNTWGGGGWGDPLTRDPDKVIFDVDAGLVTVEGAKRYGVVVKHNGTVDEKKTASLRARMAKKRGKTKVFDFGGTIPELKKRCKRETGLEAPEAPVFQSWNRGDAAGQPKAKRKKKPAAGKKTTARKKATAAKKKSGRSTARRRKAA
jgi:N-methylhydantoinase B